MFVNTRLFFVAHNNTILLNCIFQIMYVNTNEELTIPLKVAILTHVSKE